MQKAGENFVEQTRKEHARRCCRYLTQLTGADTRLLDVTAEVLENGAPAVCSRCKRGCDSATNPTRNALYGAFEADRWQGRYVYYCPCGFIYIAIALPRICGILSDAVLIGPLCMGQDVELEEGAPDPALVPAITPAAATALSELAFAAIYLPEVENLAQEAKASVEKLRAQPIENPLSRPINPANSAPRLQQLVAAGDRAGTLALLNQIVQFICWNGSGLAEMRDRIADLLSLLSRTAASGDKDTEKVFWIDKDIQAQLEHLYDAESLARWVTAATRRYISCVFDLTEIKHRDVLYKAAEYIRAHHDERLTLEQVATHVYLSRTYLSHILKKEFGVPFSDYVNRIRVEKSMLLLCRTEKSLAEVAGLVGFDGQSYFTKVFKKQTGLTPGQYRLSKEQFKLT